MSTLKTLNAASLAAASLLLVAMTSSSFAGGSVAAPRHNNHNGAAASGVSQSPITSQSRGPAGGAKTSVPHRQ